MAAVGDKEEHALSGLLDLVSELVGEYDTNHYTIEASEPKEVASTLNFIDGQFVAAQSGIGREGGVHSLGFYTELRNVCVKLWGRVRGGCAPLPSSPPSRSAVA